MPRMGIPIVIDACRRVSQTISLDLPPISGSRIGMDFEEACHPSLHGTDDLQ